MHTLFGAAAVFLLALTAMLLLFIVGSFTPWVPKGIVGLTFVGIFSVPPTVAVFAMAHGFVRWRRHRREKSRAD